DITAAFPDASAAKLSWVLNAYTIVFAALLIPAGKIADRVGHRRVFLVGSALFTGASTACGLAPTAELLIAFRVVQAAGAAALMSYGLIVTEDAGWLGAKTLALLAAGFITVGLFVWHQSRTPAPALDLDLFRLRNFSWGNLTMLIFGTAFSAMFFSSILFL